MPNSASKRNNIIAGILAVVVILVIALYVYMRPAPSSTEQVATGTPITDTTNGVTVTGGTAVVTDQPSAPSAPDYTKPLTFSADLSADVRAAFQRQFDMTIELLNKDKLNFNAWVNLATLRKSTGDYKGAETILIYVSKLYPKSTIPFDNLGSLYLDFIKDYPKAEASFKQAIQNDSHDIHAYQELFSLYTIYGYKTGTSAAADLVAQGLKDNSSNQILLELQAQLKK